MADRKDIEEIVYDKLSGEILSIEEEEVFKTWYAHPQHQKYFRELWRIKSVVRVGGYEQRVVLAEEWKKINQKITKRQSVLMWRKFVAVFILIVGIGLSLLYHEEKSGPLASEIAVVPGKKQAVLTLSTGKEIRLGDSLGIATLKEKGVVIRGLSGDVLTYDVVGKEAEPVYNRITVPRGGEYVLTLSDGSVVWLNSESSIYYPVVFTGEMREVTLTGEAFFDVKKKEGKPFIVHSEKMDIRVLGTQFNVKVYSGDEQQTTLVEGTVEVGDEKRCMRLNPGQQVRLVKDSMILQEVDPMDYIAWRYGEFNFKQCRLEDLFEELARWYDLNLFFQNPEVKDYVFTAWFKRSASVLEVISILEKTKNITIELTGKTLTIKKNHRN